MGYNADRKPQLFTENKSLRLKDLDGVIHGTKEEKETTKTTDQTAGKPGIPDCYDGHWSVYHPLDDYFDGPILG